MLTLILLPGMDGTGDLFEPLLKECNSAFRCQVVRYPNDIQMSYENLTEFVRAQLPAEGDFVLLGESFSGPIAISIATESDHRLKGLILCCTFASNPRPNLYALSPLVTIFPLKLASASIFVKGMLGKYATNVLCQLIQNSIQSVPNKTLRARLIQITTGNVEDKVKNLSVPVLYLKATNDWIVPVSASANMRKLNSTVRIVDVDGPHFLLQANPCGSAVFINEFILRIINRH